MKKAMTQEEVKELEHQLEELKTIKRKEVAEKIKVARSFGDLSENSEYDEAKNEQGKLFSRMAEIENVLAGAVIIKEDEKASGVVSHGVRVIVQFEDDDETEEYVVVGSQEADPDGGKISDESPFGKALMGRRIGDEVIVDAPAGKLKYTIVDVIV